MISDVMWNTADCEQQLKKSTNSGSSLMWCVTQQTVSSSWRSPKTQDDLLCDVKHSRLWAAAEGVHRLRMISDVMCNKADCEKQLESRNSGWSLMWCTTQQTVNSSWRSPQIQGDLWCDVQHSRLCTTAEEVHRLRMISDVMCNTADCEQQLKESTDSGWSLMWCATQQIVKSSFESRNSGWSLMWCATQQTVKSSLSPEIQGDLWCDVQHSRLWTAAEVHKFRMISDVMCNTADCEQQLKKSKYSGWSLMWRETQQTVSSSWRRPQIQDHLCDV